MSHKPHYTEPHHDHASGWFRHVPADEGAPQEEHGSHTRPIALTAAFLICFGFVGATILATYLYFNVHMAKLRREKIETTAFARDFSEYKRAEEQKLADFYFATDDLARQGVASPPVEQAKQQVIARYAAAGNK